MSWSFNIQGVRKLFKRNKRGGNTNQDNHICIGNHDRNPLIHFKISRDQTSATEVKDK